MSGQEQQAMGPATYHVVFYASQGTSAWWTKGLDQRFVHVEVWWHIGDDYWVAVRPNHCYLACDVMLGAPREGENGVSEVYAVICERGHTSPMVPFGMKTCVTVVKAVLGLRAAWIMTPRQLRNYLNQTGVVR
jgi:hypothetical protein